jgi:hypothetical protein
MKTLAFLFIGSLLLLFSGLLLSEGKAPPPAPPAEVVDEIIVADGSAKLEPVTKPTTPPILLTKPEVQKPSAAVAALQREDLCDLMSQLSRESIAERAHAPQFLQAIGASSELQQIFAVDGPVFGNSEKNLGQTVPEKFFFALRLAGMYATNTNAKQDLPRARKILLELEKEEPGNAAFPFFRFSIEQKSDEWKANVKQTLETIAQKSYFNTYLFALLQDLEPLRWRSAAYHYSITSFYDYANLQFYSPAQELIEYDAKNKTEFGKALGELMIAEPLRARRGQHVWGFSTIQYDWGRELSGSDQPYSNRLSQKIEGWEENFHFPYPPYVDRSRCNAEPYEKYVRDTLRLL